MCSPRASRASCFCNAPGHRLWRTRALTSPGRAPGTEFPGHGGVCWALVDPARGDVPKEGAHGSSLHRGPGRCRGAPLALPFEKRCVSRALKIVFTRSTYPPPRSFFQRSLFRFHCPRFPFGLLRASWGNARWEEGKTVTTDMERACGLGVTSPGTHAGRRDERGRRGGRARAGRALRLRGTAQRQRSPVQPDAAALPSPNVCEVFSESAVSKHLGGPPLSRPRHRGNRNRGRSSHLCGRETQCLEDIPGRWLREPRDET